MIDTEVIRLRQLRNTALRARAIALALIARHIESGSVLSRSALACWRIARIITGKLRAHPYQSYQRDAGYLRSVFDGAVAALIGVLAKYRGGPFGRYSARLQRVARELDDARALTWSPTLSDTLGRFGGEEFVVLLPDTQMNDACTVAERIRASICNKPFVIAKENRQISVSIGVAALDLSIPDQTIDMLAQQILAQSDQALYKAKESGRNRVQAFKQG